MSTNKHAIIRYQALDKCFRAKYKRYYIKDLIKACNDALLKFTGDSRYQYDTWMTDRDYEGVKRRQIYNDIDFMRSEAGYQAPIITKKEGREVYYTYEDSDFTINKSPITDEEIAQLKETILTLNRLKGLPHYEWMEELVSNLEDKLGFKGINESVIGLDHNRYLKGIEYLSPLFDSIVKQQVQQITYQKFEGSQYCWQIHPYYLKQYNGRWFLLGLNEEIQEITTIPLDRIKAMSEINIPFRPNNKYDFNDEYFCDIIGVNLPREKKIEKVLLKFEPYRFNYVKTKPLHESQRVHENNILELRLIINNELESLILSFGNDIEVLEPQHLRAKITEIAIGLAKKYQSVHNDCTDTI